MAIDWDKVFAKAKAMESTTRNLRGTAQHKPSPVADSPLLAPVKRAQGSTYLTGGGSAPATPYAAGQQAGLVKAPERTQKPKQPKETKEAAAPAWMGLMDQTAEELVRRHSAAIAERNALRERVKQGETAAPNSTYAASAGGYRAKEVNPISGAAAASGAWMSEEDQRLLPLRMDQERKQTEINDLAAAHYHRKNQEQFAKLETDAVSKASYMSAKELTADLDTLSKALNNPSTYNGHDSRFNAAGEALAEKYGTYDLQTLQRTLTAQKTKLVEELKAKGYDFETMAGYDRMLAQQENYQRTQEQMQKDAEEHPVSMSGFSTILAPLQGLDFVKKGLDGIGRSNADDLGSYVPNNVYDMYATNMVQTIRGTVSKKIEENTDWELFGQNVASFLYNTGMSVADSALQVATLGKGATLVMGLSSAANTTKEIIERGGSNEQAFWGGLAAGTAEMVFEKFSVESILNLDFGDGWKGAVKAVLSQAGVEASEEMMTEVANILSDTMVMGERSGLVTAAKEYEAQGVSRDKAWLRATLDSLGQVAWAGAGGALSGMGMAGGKLALQRGGSAVYDHFTRRQGQTAENVTGAGVDSRLGTDAGVDTQATQNPVEGAKNAPDGVVVKSSGISALEGPESLGKTLASSIESLKDMNSVAQLTGQEMNDRAKKPSEQIRTFFSKIGSVFRKGFGEVSFGEYGIGGMLNHRPLNRAKMVTLEAVPFVIKNGRVISDVADWKGRGYRSVVFGAPVTIGESKVYVAAVVNQNPEGKFYLSECVDSDGNYIRIENNPSDGTKSGVTAQGGITATPEKSFSIDSIPQTAQDVNPETGDGMPNSVGAAAARFAYQEAPTQSVSDRLFMGKQRRENPGLRTEPHKVYTDAEANADARERLAFDYEGEKASLETMVWGASEEKMAHMILEDLVSDAVKTGDYAEVIRWKKLYDQKGGTEVGQALHARREYADSAPHVIARAAEFLESDEVKKLTDKKHAEILKNVTEQATALEGLSDGDTAGVIDLIKRNSEIRRTTGLFSKKTAKTLSWALDAVAKLDGGYQYLKDIATAQVNSIATDYAGMGWATWVKNIRVTHLLSKVSTVMRNIGGNQLFDLAESMSTDLGVVADMLMSTASGRRTTAMDKSWFSAAKRNGSFEGALKSYVAVALDAGLDADVRYEGTGGRTFKMTGNPLVRFLSTYAKFQSYALTTTDEFAKGGTRAETQRGIDALREAGKLGDETMDGWADEIAKQRTFQNDGALAKVTLGMRSALNNISATDKYGGKFGAGDVAIPFARVPANLPARLADYTPLGLGKSLVQLVKACWDGKHGKLTSEHQAQVALNMGRGTTGTALLAAITFLGYMGAVRVAGDDDEDKEALEKAQRQNGTQWNLDASLRALSGEGGEWQDGDTLMSVGWLEPLSGLLSIGALLGESIKEDGVSLKTAWDGTDATFSGMIQSVLDTPAMSWINDLQTAYKYSDGETDSEKFVDTAIDYVGGQVSGLLVPNAVRGIAQGTDNVVRNTYTSKNPFVRVVQQVQSGIPGLRQKLPAAADGFGRERTYTDSDAANFLNSSILPGQVTTYHQTEVEKELERVSDATEDYRSTHNIGSIFPMKGQVSSLSFTDEDGVSHKVTLDAAQVAEYNKVRGTTHLVAVTEMMGNRHYKAADVETKAKLLQNCREYASLRARVEALTKTEDRDGYEVPSEYKKAQTAQGAGVLADYYFYKLEQKKLEDKSSGEAADEALREELRGDKSLTKDQKEVLDELLISDTVIIPKDLKVDYSDQESFTITQMSEAAQKKWSRAQELGYTAQEYKTYYGIYAQQGKKKDEKLKELEAAGLSRREAKAFWRAMGEKDEEK